MDLQAMMDDGGPWTEERHSSFLNWMEESFVRRMLTGADLQASCSATCNCHRRRRCRCRHLPLDRYLPDSATESTRDFHGPRRSSGTGRPMRSPVSVHEEEEEEEEPGRASDPTPTLFLSHRTSDAFEWIPSPPPPPPPSRSAVLSNGIEDRGKVTGYFSGSLHHPSGGQR